MDAGIYRGGLIFGVRGIRLMGRAEDIPFRTTPESFRVPFVGQTALRLEWAARPGEVAGGWPHDALTETLLVLYPEC